MKILRKLSDKPLSVRLLLKPSNNGKHGEARAAPGRVKAGKRGMLCSG